MMLIECVFVILLINSTISSLVHDNYIENYVEFDSNKSVFLSGATSINVGFGDSDKFFGLVSQIEEVEGVTGVAYQCEEYFVSNKSESDSIIAYYINQGMQKVKYPLKEGEWFKGINNDVLEIVVGGNIARKCKVGEIITLNKLEYINNKLEYIKVDAKVIGILCNPPYIANLHYGSNKPTFGNLFDSYRDVIITNNESIVSKDDVRFPLESLIVFIDENNKTVINGLKNFGQPILFKDIIKNSQEASMFSMKNKIPTSLVTFLAILFGLIGITLLKSYKDMRTLSILYLYGLSKKQCIALSVTSNTFIFMLSVLLSFILAKTSLFKEYLFRGSVIGLYNYIFIILFLLVIMFITYIISKAFSKESPVRKLRRFE